ncbi:chemotaxis protein CheD [Oceanobacillus massiliensis]|uniref:chemotaxis protein CheD n=1 Tax=Oceanobacillus massiliensis TaxID=1465765 RepID=UPI000288AA73|nr:chemotaxis protein CheD [Oceanobacillus massiliensis]
MSETTTIIKVGIADLNIVKPPNIIRTSGLGSCIGVVIYDESKMIAGLSHVLLPDSHAAKQTKINKFKYADTAIPCLVDLLLENGARKFGLKAKMAGGAQMFQFSSGSDIMRIGPRNAEAVQQKLHEFQIPIIASDVGGNVGRTIEFDPIDCKMKIRKINKEEFFI